MIYISASLTRETMRVIFRLREAGESNDFAFGWFLSVPHWWN